MAWTGKCWSGPRQFGTQRKQERPQREAGASWSQFETTGTCVGAAQRAAVAVEQASFPQHGGDRKTKESFKVENSILIKVADAQGIGRKGQSMRGKLGSGGGLSMRGKLF